MDTHLSEYSKHLGWLHLCKQKMDQECAQSWDMQLISGCSHIPQDCVN